MDTTRSTKKRTGSGLSSVEEPDYVEVYEDLQFYIANSRWKDGVPKWALDWACEESCYVEDAVVFYRAWKFVAEHAMKRVAELEDRMEDQRLDAAFEDRS
jgi:hypothetical protein